MSCDLWMDDDFAYGSATWNSRFGSLVYDLTGDRSSLHTATDDEIGGVLGTPADAVPTTEWSAEQEFLDICDQREHKLLAEWDSGDEPGNYTIDGVLRMWNPDFGVWETKALKCHCDDEKGFSFQSDKKICERCMVWRPGKKQESPTTWFSDQVWRPFSYGENELWCKCNPPREYSCNKCNVKRDNRESPWQTWNGQFSYGPGTVSTGGATTYNYNEWGNEYGTTWSLCRHRGRELVLPNGNVIYGSSESATDNPEFKADFGVYLDKSWTPVTLALYIPWADMGLPGLKYDYMDQAVDLIIRMSSKGQNVEIGCIGGHGRTGTLMALVVMRSGLDLEGSSSEVAKRAIDYVRENYCSHAIESLTQEWYIEAFYCVWQGLEVPDKPETTTSFSSGTPTGENHGYEVPRRCDTNGQWYCGGCQKDNKSDWDVECWYCRGVFDLPGARAIEDWNTTYVNSHKEKAVKRVALAHVKMLTDPQTLEPWETDHTRDRSNFELNGRTYIKTDRYCVKCHARLYLKCRKATGDLPSRTELVHEKTLKKLRRCKG